MTADVSTQQQGGAGTAPAESEKSQEQIESEAEIKQLRARLKEAENQLRRINNSLSPVNGKVTHITHSKNIAKQTRKITTMMTTEMINPARMKMRKTTE